LPLTPDETSQRQPLREKLQAEMERLAAARSAANATAPEEPNVRLAERSCRPRLLGRLLLVGPIAALALCALGGGLWLYAHSRGQATRDTEAKVQAAVADAQRVDSPGHEADALAAWQIAYRQIILYQQSPQDFQAEMSLAKRRIGELQDALKRAAAPAQSTPKAATAAPGHSAPPTQLAAPPPQGAAAPAPPSLAQIIAAVRQSSVRGEPVVVIDAPGEVQRWQAESWADPVGLRLEAAEGSRFVVLEQKDGKAGKWVVSIDQPLDLTPYDSLTLDVRNEEPVALAVAVWTQPGSAMFETPTQSLPIGDHTGVSFALKGKQFKSQRTNWQFGTEIGNPANAVRLSIFIYTRSQTPIRFRNVCLRKAEAK
jgi:hypothetical protein